MAAGRPFKECGRPRTPEIPKFKTPLSLPRRQVLEPKLKPTSGGL